MTEEHRLEVADVFRKYGGAYLEENGASTEQRRVLRDVASCRSPALGGHVKRCDDCGHEEFFYKSCGNRHCPKCQGTARAKWLEGRAEELLETHYFHVVFTLPHKLGPIALQNKRVVYGLLFRAASQTLTQIAKDPKHLGAEIGFLAVLHTWGQRLDFHPHVHCVVPGGGFSSDRTTWISSRKKFFVPVKVLSRVFRGKFVAFLRKAFNNGELSFHGQLQRLRHPVNFEAELKTVRTRDWVVYSKPPFGSAKVVLKYLASYTHRVAISNHRLVSDNDGTITFRWKDYAHGGRKKLMTLEANEFIRRFLLHVLPNRLQRIRHYGFLSNRVRKERVTLARKLLGQNEEQVDSAKNTEIDDGSVDAVISDSERCPECKRGRLVAVRDLEPDSAYARRMLQPQTIDSS